MRCRFYFADGRVETKDVRPEHEDSRLPPRYWRLPGETVDESGHPVNDFKFEPDRLSESIADAMVARDAELEGRHEEAKAIRAQMVDISRWSIRVHTFELRRGRYGDFAYHEVP